MGSARREISGKSLLDEHFARPRNVGRLANATHGACVENPVCNDTLELSLRLEGDLVREARFLARGCSATIALASIATERALGRSKSEIFSWGEEEIRDWVGGLPRAKTHSAELIRRAFRDALQGKE